MLAFAIVAAVLGARCVRGAGDRLTAGLIMMTAFFLFRRWRGDENSQPLRTDALPSLEPRSCRRFGRLGALGKTSKVSKIPRTCDLGSCAVVAVRIVSGKGVSAGVEFAKVVLDLTSLKH